MFTRLRARNFKAWSESLWEPGIDLAPITLLLGPNSVGKTSLMQIPLLLKQTFESPDRRVHLNLGGQPTDLVDVGSFESLVHGHDEARVVGLGFAYQPHNHTGNAGGPELRYQVTYRCVGGAPAVQELRLSSDDLSYSVARQLRGGYLLSAPGYQPAVIGDRQDARRSFQPERAVAFSAEAIAELGPNGHQVEDLSLRLREAANGIAYLGPLRIPPDRSYTWSGVEPGDLGKRGERAVHALLASDNARERQREGEEGGSQWLVERVSRWLKRMEVADELKLERQGNSRHYELVIIRGHRRDNLIDVGFGISQVLPILVLAYFVPRGTTIVAEEPEIHLHPRAQGCLAELMADVAHERGVQFLVETHSEHLFRRLQTLIAAGTIRREQCRLYFVNGAEDRSEANLSTLELDEFGRVQNWPDDFFGDAVGEVERQTDLMLRRTTGDDPRG